METETQITFPCNEYGYYDENGTTTLPYRDWETAEIS